MTLESDQTAEPVGSKALRLRLTARHEGWTPFSLFLGPIAVVVEAEHVEGSPGPVAIGMATVVPRRSRIPRG